MHQMIENRNSLMKEVAIIPVENEELDFIPTAEYAIREGLMPIIVSREESVLRKARREGFATFEQREQIKCPQEFIDIVCNKYQEIEHFVVINPKFKTLKKSILNKMVSSLKRERHLFLTQQKREPEWVIVGRL